MSKSLEICLPDIGDFEEVEVVELLVAKGDVVAIDDPLVSVESDKATMEIPSTAAGVVLELRVAEGDRVSQGSVLVILAPDGKGSMAPASSASEAEASPARDSEESPSIASTTPEEPVVSAAPPPLDSPPAETSSGGDPLVRDETAVIASSLPKRQLSLEASNPVPDRLGGAHASPLVRRYARELGIPVDSVEGTGPHNRLLVDDVKQHVRARFGADAPGAGGRGSDSRSAVSGSGIPPMPVADHGTFGPIHEEPLTRIQKVSGPALHRSWLNVPHVTQYDESDVTELERFRRDRRALASERGVKLSPLLFVMKAVVRVLEEFPNFRSSLAPEGDRLIVKDYFHLGIAVDTDQGLVVPVIRDVDRKGVFELASEVNATAERARAKKLTPDDLKGACFTISSLGGIGGTGFSPIVNAPEVAILGLSKTRTQPVWRGPSPLDLAPSGDASSEVEASSGYFEPRLVMPFSLSYDHRVIDGASAVRFTTRLARVLSDPAHLLL